MANYERITVTLPQELVRDIDQQEKNRSKFVADAVRNELELRRRAELRRSLSNPHPDTADLSSAGLVEWGRTLPCEDLDSLTIGNGKPIRWVPGKGWISK